MVTMIEDNSLKAELEQTLKSGTGPKIARFALAILSGAIPLAGGLFSGASGAWSEAEQDHFKRILAAWLKLQEEEIEEIGRTLAEVMVRVDQGDEAVRNRLESKEYLSLLKKCFRDWSAAESEEKRRLIRNLLCNAAAPKQLCSDDILRLFVEWIEKYSEQHFAVIRSIYSHPGTTRADIWQELYGIEVREDSAEADLFKLLIYDLSTGHVIRQRREKDYQGNFLKSPKTKSSGPKNPYVKSAFDDGKEYELTELGRWFVHYTMNEIVPKLRDIHAEDPAFKS